MHRIIPKCQVFHIKVLLLEWIKVHGFEIVGSIFLANDSCRCLCSNASEMNFLKSELIYLFILYLFSLFLNLLHDQCYILFFNLSLLFYRHSCDSLLHNINLLITDFLFLLSFGCLCFRLLFCLLFLRFGLFFELCFDFEKLVFGSSFYPLGVMDGDFANSETVFFESHVFQVYS